MKTGTPARKTPIPTDPLRRTAWVQAELKCRGLSFRKLGQIKGLNGNSLSQTMWKPSARAERIIAEAIGLTPKDIWPERFNPQTGKRLHRVFHNQPIGASAWTSR